MNWHTHTILKENSGFYVTVCDSWFTTGFWIFLTEFFVIKSVFTTIKKGDSATLNFFKEELCIAGKPILKHDNLGERECFAYLWWKFFKIYFFQKNMINSINWQKTRQHNKLTYTYVFKRKFRVILHGLWFVIYKEVLDFPDWILCYYESFHDKIKIINGICQ